MDQILDFIHGFIKWTFTLITLLVVDLPLKVICCVLVLVLGLIWSIIYPLVKKINAPSWIEYIYAYATRKDVLVSKVIYKLWKV